MLIDACTYAYVLVPTDENVHTVRTGNVFLLVLLYSLFFSLIQVLQESEKKIQMCEIIIQQRGASPLKGKVV